MSKDIFKHKDSELVSQLTHLKESVPTYKVQLGLTDPDVTAIQGSCENTIHAVGAHVSAKAAAKSAKENKEAVKKLELGNLRTAINKFKTADGYTKTIGEDLGVVGETVTIDPGTYKPVIKAETHPGYVIVSFTKLGVDGVNVYARLKGEGDWKKLAFDSSSPYIDNRPLAEGVKAENREYSAIGVIDDEEIGQRSDMVGVSFGG